MASSSDEYETVFVELLDEGVPVWRPALAKSLGNQIYELALRDDYEDLEEKWAFMPGTKVVCEEKIFSDGSKGFVPIKKV